jgi:hypothetical protein
MVKAIRGGTLPALMWKSFMERASAGQPILPLPGTDVVDPPEASRDNATDFDRLLVGLFDEPRAGDKAKQN